MRWTAIVLLGLAAAAACAPADEPAPTGDEPPAAAVDWAIAIHGGAGVIDREKYAGLAPEYEDALKAALRLGAGMLDEGRSGLDVVEAVVRLMEDDPHFNAGKGAVFTHEGGHELDASIMDGDTLGCGAVTGVTTVKHPITLARKVMERSKHVFFSGAGAEAFADQVGVERVDPDYFSTPQRYEQWQAAIKKERPADDADETTGAGRPGGSGAPGSGGSGEKGTVGCVVLDRAGNLAAATSTGGLTNKLFGRIGDSPMIGAGTYADNRSCAVSGTGQGEQFIRHTVARSIAALVQYGGMSLEEACDRVVFHELAKDDGGVIAVGRDGSIAMVYSTQGMFRGAADSSGRFEVAIWD